MFEIFKKKGAWVVSLFLIINILGLAKIISLLEYKKGYYGICSYISEKMQRLSSPIGKAIKIKYKEDFKVNEIKPKADGSNLNIAIDLSQEVDLDKIKGYIEVTPKVDFYAEQEYPGIVLHGDFKPGTSYTVELLKGMPSTENVLKESIKKTIVMPDYDATVRFKAPGMYMSLRGNQIIPIEVVNVDKVKIKIHKVYDNNIVYLLNNIGSYGFPSDLGMDKVEKDIAAKAERNQLKELPIYLKEILSSDAHGLYFMTVSDASSEYNWGADSKLILTTDIGIVAKKSNSDLLVWLNSLATTSSIANATVRVYTKTNQQILHGVTDESGLVHFKDVDWSGDKKPFIITASTENDLSYIELEKCTLAETDFDVQGRPYLSAGYEGFLYTDRGVYRPGEKVFLRAILRGIGVEVPESFPVVFDIKKPDGGDFKKLNGMLSSFGTVDMDIDIPDYALTGGYTVNLMLPGSNEIIGSCKFNVEEFLPDRIEVAINVPEKRFALADTITIKVKAEHFFGAPASDMQVEAKYNLKPVDFKPVGYDSYTFSDPTKDFNKKSIDIGEGKTDAEGIVTFDLKLPEDVAPPSALNCSISATVKETGGRAVTSYAERSADPYPYYIGVRKSVEGYASTDEPVKFEYVLVTPDGKKTSVPELSVNISKIIWNNVLKKDEKGEYRYVSESKEEVVFEDTIRPTESLGTISFTPKSWGDYIMRIKGKDKNTHTAGVKFYCSEPGYMPWAMERPDKIELGLDKQAYAIGDQARLVIKAPFKGKALITISKDEVISVKSIELTDSTQEIPISIDESFAPNAYCAITVIKPVISDEQWVSHRAYGIIPITLDNSAHKLNIDIKAPSQAAPKDTIKVDIDVKSANPTELSVALVDEGILRLTGFKTPDPFDFFYGRKGNYIATSDIYSLLMPEFDKKKIGADSTPSGDKGPEYDPKKHLNPISAKRVKPIVLWKTNVITDKQGKASLEFKMPEFVGNLKVMAVAVSDRDFGSIQGDVKVVEPLMIMPTIPRFLSSGDEFILPVTIINKTGKDGNVTISLELSDGFKLTSENSINISVKNNGDGAGSFKITAPKAPQKGEIKIIASMDNFTSSVTTELPIRPAAPFTTLSGSGMLKAPGKGSVNIPGGWLSGTEQYALSVMPLPELRFAGGLKYLVQYPYGCIEQTTSCIYPLLYLKDVAAAVDPKKFSPQMIDNYIDNGIQRMLSMQTHSGAFSFWPGYREPYSWGSVYATDFMVEAEKAGYAVPKSAKDNALNYLERLLSSSDEDVSLDLKAYSCFVLSKAGRIKASWIRRLQEVKKDLMPCSRFQLAASLAAMGDKKAVADILGEGYPDTKVKRETGDSLNSYARENAIVLSAYMDLDPNNAIVPTLVKRLENAMKDGNWGTTQDNAMALLALGKYARFIEGQDANYTGSVSIGKDLIAEFSQDKETNVKGIDLGGKSIDLSVQGKGSAYYYWSAEGVPTSGKAEEKDKGIKVRRSFLTKDGGLLAMGDIKQGQIIVVDILIKGDLAYKNVVVEDLLPACFEIENPRIATSESVEWIRQDIIEPQHIDIRDDRFLIFTDLPSGKAVHYRYVVRAVTKGDFTLPAVSASCMYDPNIVSVSGQGTIQVKDYAK